MVLPIQFAKDLIHAHAVSQQLLDGGFQLVFLRIHGGFGIRAGLFGFQLVDGLLSGLEGGAVGFQLCLKAVDLVEARVSEIFCSSCAFSVVFAPMAAA